MKKNKVDTTKEANALKKQLKKKIKGDWKVKVWYNLHWCYSVTLNGVITIYSSSTGDYHTSIHQPNDCGESAIYNQRVIGKNPVKVVKESIKEYKANVDAEIARQQIIFDRCEGLLN